MVEVVLTQDDPKLGRRGEVIKVAPGFAMNFLFPQKKAQAATAGNLKIYEKEKEHFSAKQSEVRAQAEALAKKIEGINLRLEVLTGEADKLFGAVTVQDILERLAGKGVSLDKKKIHLAEPLKALGDYEVPVKLHSQVSTKLKLSVVKKSK